MLACIALVFSGVFVWLGDDKLVSSFSSSKCSVLPYSTGIYAFRHVSFLIFGCL